MYQLMVGAFGFFVVGWFVYAFVLWGLDQPDLWEPLKADILRRLP